MQLENGQGKLSFEMWKILLKRLEELIAIIIPNM
jgi:hypothetical protein